MILIVDPRSRRRCADGQVGEVWVHGGSVTRGYWGRLEESDETFRARLADEDGTDQPRASLRTGDLGFVDDQQLFLTGRLKDVIIIRGGNIYPQDIEATVQHAHSALRPDCGAAFSCEADGEERLVVVHELHKDFRTSPVCIRRSPATFEKRWRPNTACAFMKSC